MNNDMQKIMKLLQKRNIIIENITEIGKHTVMKINNGMEMIPFLFSKDTGKLVRVGNPFEMPDMNENIPF